MEFNSLVCSWKQRKEIPRNRREFPQPDEVIYEKPIANLIPNSESLDAFLKIGDTKAVSIITNSIQHCTRCSSEGI